jgi:hypothetical protein
MQSPKQKKEILEFYSRPGAMTFAGKYAQTIRRLPNDIDELTRIVKGLVIHEYVALPFYGVGIPGERAEESHIRRSEDLLEALMARDGRPLTEPRPPEKRLVGVCHHFAKILLTFLRAKNIPSRMRYGFGSYFNLGFYEDHSLCEYWNKKEARWVFVDPQFDEVWREKLDIKHSRRGLDEVP